MSKVIQTVEELGAVLHWRNKHAVAIRERDALQLLLNERDEANHDLEQRRHAEQQACQAAERRAGELEELLGTSQVYITDLASSLENACEFSEGNEEDDPQATEECDEARAFAMRINAALNPTAEAASHEN